MKTPARLAVLFSLALLGASPGASALDGMVIVHPSVTVTQLTSSALKDILTGKTMYWEGGEAIVIVYSGGQADPVLKQASGMDSNAFRTFWQRLAFSGRAKPPKKVDDVPNVVTTVASTKGAMAVVTSNASTSGVTRISVD